jgi:hypothetical protein
VVLPHDGPTAPSTRTTWWAAARLPNANPATLHRVLDAAAGGRGRQPRSRRSYSATYPGAWCFPNENLVRESVRRSTDNVVKTKIIPVIDPREPISRISIHPRTPPAVRLGTGVNKSTPGPLVTPGPRGGSTECGDGGAASRAPTRGAGGPPERRWMIRWVRKSHPRRNDANREFHNVHVAGRSRSQGFGMLVKPQN